MIDKSLLVLLLATVLFIVLVKPHSETAELLQNRIGVLDTQIAAQENLKRHKAETVKRAESIMKASTANESYFFPAEQSNSESFVEFMDLVKNAAKTCNMEFANSNWGEPYPDPKTGMIKLPLSVVVRGIPSDASKFLRTILFSEKVVKVEHANVMRYQDQQLALNLAIVAYKPDRGKH